tara:strand:+ start:911 stop:1177 length:267 start_codon:yes stop_codon:yes gene_type:complete
MPPTIPSKTRHKNGGAKDGGNHQIQAELKAGVQTLTIGQRIIEFIEVCPKERLPINVTKFDTQDIQNLISIGERDVLLRTEHLCQVCS